MQKIELLAPAGNMESLVAAVEAGADAVYLGLTSFSARAFAGNFTEEEFQQAIQYCHIRDVKIYVTMNTMMYETEIENAKKTIQFLYENDVDAVLIQDLGLFHWIRQCYPDLEIHCSTQMHIHNMNGVKFMQKQGASRVVLARETPIEIIKEAVKTGMEIEVFVYGAICISYSGQCLMSASLKNRSANRGMCAQCCRLRYYQQDGTPFDKGKFLLSPKDLNVIEQVPQLIEAGVASLKIEGRMKRPEYVWLITKTFREAIDAYYAHKSFVLTKQRQEELLLMFNRGFSKGHLFHDDVGKRMSQFRPNHMGVEIGKVLSFSNDQVTVKLSKVLHQHDGLRILNEPYDTGLTAVKILKNGKLVNSADPGDIVTLQCKSRPIPKKGSSLQKTSDALLVKEIQDKIQNDKKILPIQIHYEANTNVPLKLQLKDEHGTVVSISSDTFLQEAKNAPITKENMERLLSKTNDYPFVVTKIEGNLGNIFAPVKMINETRRNLLDKYVSIKSKQHKRIGKKEYDFHVQASTDALPRLIVEDLHIDQIHEEHITKYPFLPVIDENQNTDELVENTILSQVGDLNRKHIHCIAGMTFNVANSYALAFLLSLDGIDGVFFSTECNHQQIQNALDTFKERYGFTPQAYKFVYGHRNVMYIKDSFYKPIPDSFIDEQNIKYRVHYSHDITEIEDPILYQDTNEVCYGSYLLESGIEKKYMEEEKKIYEEISRRI